MSAKTDEVPTALSRQDLVLINNALNEILNGPHAIGDLEFETRTGVDRAYAEKLLKRCGTLIDQLGHH
jgi:hypothetical protein